MIEYGKRHPTVGRGLELYEIKDCYVIRVGDKCVRKIVYETVYVNFKGIYNSTFYLGPMDTHVLIIKDLWLAQHLAESVAKAFPGQKTKIMTWLESMHMKGNPQ